MSTRPIYADLADKGKSDPYHNELSHADLLHLELLKYARTHPGMFTADDLIAIIEAMEA